MRPPCTGSANAGDRRVMLRIEKLSIAFGGVEALAGLDLEVPAGTVLGLIGPNGSGKTTLFNVLTGVYPADTGRIYLRDSEISRCKTEQIVRLGVARTFQNLRLYRRMTVFDNVRVAQHSLPGTHFAQGLLGRSPQENQRREAVRQMLELTGLSEQADQLAGGLPLPLQRRLELARALIRQPDLLLLDEPAGGMTPAETSAMADLIHKVASPDRTMIVIEHKMELLSDLCQRMCVLNFGRKIAEGEPRQVLEHPDVLEAYLGRSPSGA